MRHLKALLTILTLGPGILLAQGFTGHEVTHTQVFDKTYTSSVTTLRKYENGFFVDVELFNSREPVVGLGFQHADKTTILDIRFNENNTKLFIMKRF